MPFQKKPKVKDPGDEGHAYAYALFLLNIRMRSEAEVHKSMIGRGYNPNVIAKIIEQLKGLNYINDAAFAETLVENFKKYRNYGYYLIKQKLMAKLLSNTQIEKTLNTHLSLEEELAIAKRI